MKATPTLLLLLMLSLAAVGACRGLHRVEVPPQGSETPGAAALRRLIEASGTRPELRFDRGLPVHARVAIAVDGTTPLDRARSFLDAHRELYRLEDPSRELFLVRRVSEGQRTHLFFGQQVGGSVVFGAALAVHLDGSTVTGTAGRWLPHARTQSGALPAGAAEARALASLGLTHGEVIGRARRVLFDPSLLSAVASSPAPAWRVTVRGLATATQTPGIWTVLIDTRDGSVLKTLEEHRGHAFTLRSELFDVSDLIDRCDRSRPLPADADATTTRAAGFADDTVTYFHDRFGAHSIDDSGVLAMGVHWPHPLNARYNPDCNELRFNDQYLKRDVFAHEYTHGVDFNLGPGLLTTGQAAVVAESYADVFGVLVDGGDWTVAEGTPTPPRSLSDPPAYGQPDHMDDLHPGSDRGAIYANTGIPNKAGYLLGAGGTHRGITVTGIGREKLAQLFYGALTLRLTPTADLMDARDAAIDQADDFVRAREHGFTRDDVCSVAAAYAAVGLGHACGVAEGDRDLDYVPDRVDHCPDTPDPYQQDQDGDMQGDACDPDIDGDGIDQDGGSGAAGPSRCRGGVREDCHDNCPRVPNADQADQDGDGYGDACEDSDRDGWLDGIDNCPNHPNRGQEDLDDDRVGDVCDDDADGDGIPERLPPGTCTAPPEMGCACRGGARVDCIDNCLVLSDRERSENPDQADADGDAVGDSCDNCEGVDTRNIRDTDGDGVGDACDPDIDGDGICNGFTPRPPPAPPPGPCAESSSLYSTLDNCPYEPNPGQFDLDHDGQGLLCDPDEPLNVGGPAPFRVVERVAAELFERSFVVPLGPCLADGCPDWLLPDIRLRVRARIGDLPLAVSVLDSRGFLAARGHGKGELVFAPAPSAAFQGGPQSSFRAETYSLRVAPAAKAPADLGDTVQLELEVTTETAPGSPNDPHP